jgi:uncharacterized SAM-binding protein YcdF (DUF218 family)
VIRRLLTAVVVVVVAWIALSLVFFTWSPWETGAPRHADAVIVLSGGRERLPPALALVRRGVAPVLAISSVSHTRSWPLARRLCKRAWVLCFDAKPYSTRGEAETVARLARRHGWTNIVVVTSSFHVTRAHMLFRRCYHGGLSLVGVSYPWWKLPGEWVSETGKLIVQLTAQRSC